MEKVLAVDDDASFLEGLQELLEGSDYSVETCTDPLKVIGFLAESPVHCMIIDYRMPRMDGLDLLHMVHSKYPEMPVIICSGFVDFPRSYLLREGACDILQKPFDHGALLEALGKAITHKDEVTPIWIKGYSLKSARDEATRKIIIKALSRTHFNVTHAASLLGVTRQCLLRYMKIFQIHH